MSDIINGVSALVSLAMSGILATIGLVVWFFVNRASVKANEQIRLLEELLEEQKRQSVMLHRLSANLGQQEADARGYIHLIPER